LGLGEPLDRTLTPVADNDWEKSFGSFGLERLSPQSHKILVESSEDSSIFSGATSGTYD